MVQHADILAARRGLVIAPAGCGKTQSIIESVLANEGKPALVLTHTNAGRIALGGRLSRRQVPASRYRLATLDGWAMRLVGTYPLRSGFVLDGDAPNYPALRRAASNLIASRAIDEILLATYSRLLVDEYQDCSTGQHGLALSLSRLLPTCVFGDNLQAVFDFDPQDRLPGWNVVAQAYAEVGQLAVPHRWNNVGANDLGAWLLQSRATLLRGGRIDVSTGGERVRWRQLTGNDGIDVRAQIAAQFEIDRNRNETVLIIGDARNVASRHEYARHADGVGVVEPVELRGMIDWARRMDGQQGQDLFDVAMEFAREVMVNLEGDRLRRRLEVLSRGRNRQPPSREETAAQSVIGGGGYGEAVHFLKVLVEDRNRRIFRRGLFAPMMGALEAAARKPEEGLILAAASVRDQNRFAGRRLPARAVGSTLLLKGLESDHALILNADRMTAPNLYVALSRGSRSVTVFSTTPMLPRL